MSAINLLDETITQLTKNNNNATSIDDEKSNEFIVENNNNNNNDATSTGLQSKSMDDKKLDDPISKNPGYGSVDDQLKEYQSRSPKLAKLTLEDGTMIEGYSFGSEVNVSGEVVFNTGMVGYPESLTDPSYSGQILVLTYPLIGNYGVPSEDELDQYGLHKYFESDCIQITALIVSDYSFDHSHHAACLSLSQWLIKHNIPALYNIDTRMMVKKLRTKGTMLGKIEFNHLPSIQMIDPYQTNLVAKVSRKSCQEYNNDNDNDNDRDNNAKTNKKIKIIAIDCGIKNNIIRYLCSKGVHLKVVPWDYDFNNETFDGLFISNGPGDPVMADKTVINVRKFMKLSPDIPLFGICLGNQILALAAGGKTYKMKFGNRGMNQPVIDLRTSRCYITPQNHGFAVDELSLNNSSWKPFFRNANDNSNEGIIHTYKPWFSVQFHPEAQGGPTDTEFLFDMFLSRIQNRNYYEVTTLTSTINSMNILNNNLIESVLLLGSGGLSIGQAGEFDYSGSQAIKALKEENINVILINPNIATVQTSSGNDNYVGADEIYFVPVTPEYVTRIIEKERPDGILLQFGGQTALNCGIKLKESGIFDYYNVRVLGTPIDTIQMTEDRQLFANKLKEVNEKVAPSMTATNIDDAIKGANIIGYPVLLRSAFALGGLGSGFANNVSELKKLATKAFANSSQVIIDKSLKGWKEVEYEVVRDISDNCITVCNMENFDPLGIHTGDSIVVAPSQTLSNNDYYMLRSAAIKIVRHLGVVGECNIQYALDPHSSDYCVIEVNARLSRSSALASKATGYPLAYVAAKLSLNKILPSIKNSITKATQACFEPSLDYCVVKIPRWDIKKFETRSLSSTLSFKLGSAMKSVGEVMAIDRKFEAAFNKALRMVYSNNNGCDGFGFIPNDINCLNNDELNRELMNPSDQRVFMIALAFKRGYTVNKIYDLTKIDKWFLCKLRNIIVTEKLISIKYNSINKLNKNILLTAKQYGFSDLQIARILNQNQTVKTDIETVTENDIRNLRKNVFNITPFVKQIDTLAAEFPAFSNYLYVTYNGSEHDLTFNENGIIVLGCGAYRIGSSCEFDWCAVSAIRTVRQLNNEMMKRENSKNINSYKNYGYNSYKKKKIVADKNKKNKVYSSIVINYNPETVSTDYDECDRMYFEELSYERVLDIYEIESNCRGIIVSVGGQISNNLAQPLYNAGCKILGTQPANIDNAENRHKFSKLLDDLHIDQPLWCEARTLNEALLFSKKVGYPVLIRPSYVLSGAAMNVSYNNSQLSSYLKKATEVSKKYPVVISKFVSGAKEIEFDAVANNGNILNYAISEHIENAGVHSGDATLVLPAQNLYTETTKRIKKISRKISHALNITGPFNIQFLSKDNCIKVIECNLRASRSFPFVSKTFNINFIELATKSMVLGTNYDIKSVNFNLNDMDFVCVKSPMFSFTRLDGADPILRVEMASTGEVACFGDNKYEAFLKSIVSTGAKLPIPNPLLSSDINNVRLDYIYSDLHKSSGKLIPGLHNSSNSPSPSPSSPRSPQSPSRSSSSTTSSSANNNDNNNDNYKYFKSKKFKHLYRSNILISIGPQKAKYKFVDCVQLLKQMGFTIYATENTNEFYKTHNIDTILVNKPNNYNCDQAKANDVNIINLIENGKIHFVLNIPASSTASSSTLTDGYQIRRKSVDFGVPLISNIKLAKLFVRSLAKKYLKSYECAFDDEFLHIKSWKEYMQSTKTKYRTTTYNNNSSNI